MSTSPNMDRLRLEALERRRIEAGNLVKSRKRKLAELYSVSILSRIREVNDDASLRPIGDSLMSFLEKNDLQNNHVFDINTLPSVNSHPLHDQQLEQQPIQHTIQSQQPPVSLQQPLTQQQQQPDRSEPPSSEITTEKPGAETQTLQHKEPTFGEVTRAPIESPVEKPVPKEVEGDGEKQSKDQPQITRRPIIKKKKTPEERISYYNPENKEAIDTHVLLLREQLPAKIAEATPLAELYYLAQTLPLVKLMPSTHKVVTSTMFETALTEGKINVVHSRIEELKRQGKWSLRQPTKFVDPIRGDGRTHWDNLLSEMNWMATDFREERKLKIATCAFIAQSIADYWKYGKVCCVKRAPIQFLEDASNGKEMDLLNLENASDGEDELAESENNSIDISKLLERPDPSTEFTPAELPHFTEEEYVEKSEISPFKLSLDYDSLSDQNRTLLEEMPAFSSFEQFDDKFSKAPLVPVSKALIPIEDDSWYNVLFKQIIDDSNIVPHQQKGLFGFTSQKKINTSIKPPPPPSLKYLDLRTPTIWLPEDDQNLIEYVNRFSFNWGVVSAYLSKKPTRSYSSNIERRTPWQCFERYIQLNDTFQINDMRGQNTLSAMKWLEHAHNIQATTKRRISPLGVGVDSIQRGHKRLRWASMFEAVRKCMRKRESVTRPNNNQVRKSGDDKKINAPTPAELSKLKFERDKAIQEAYMQNPANGFRGRIPQQGGPTGNSNSAAHPRVPNSSDGSSVPSGAPRSASQSQAQSQNHQQQQQQQSQQQQGQQRFNDVNKRPNSVPVGQSQSRQGIAQVNASAANAGVPSNIPNSQQRPGSANPVPKITGPNGIPYTPEQVQQLMQLRQRKLMQQQTQQQAQGNAGGIQQASPSPNNIGNTKLVNSAMNQADLNNNGNINKNMRSNSNPQGSATSSPLIGQSQVVNPNMNNANNVNNNANNNTNNNNNGRKLTFVPAHVSAIINQIQSQNPNMSKQEVTKIAAQYLANLQAKQHRANAMNGNNNTTNGNGASQKPSPSVQNSVNHTNTSQGSPSGMGQAKISSGIPTPQQILQQQGVSSSPTIQSPLIQPQQPVRIQQQQQSPTVSSPQIPLQQSNSMGGQASPSLTPQQKAQLDMLKALHAEQQQKRQQQQQQQQGAQQFPQFQQQPQSQLQQLPQQSGGAGDSQLPQHNIQTTMQNSTQNKSNAKSTQSK